MWETSAAALADAAVVRAAERLSEKNLGKLAIETTQ